jgi:hypothetical protein
MIDKICNHNFALLKYLCSLINFYIIDNNIFFI